MFFTHGPATSCRTLPVLSAREQISGACSTFRQRLPGRNATSLLGYGGVCAIVRNVENRITLGDPEYSERTLLGSLRSFDGVGQLRARPGTKSSSTRAFADGSRAPSPSTSYAASDKQRDFQSASYLRANCQVPRVTCPRQIRRRKSTRFVTGNISVASLRRLRRNGRTLRFARRRAFFEQLADQIAKIILIRQIRFASRTTLGADHAGPVNHHHLGNLETFRDRTAQVAIHEIRCSEPHGVIEFEKLHQVTYHRLADSIVEDDADRSKTATGHLAVQLVDLLRHAQAASTADQHELDH